MQQAKQARLHAHRFGRSEAIDARNVAGGFVEAELRVEPLDFVERLLAGGAQPHRIVTVQDQLEARRHCLAGERNGSLHGKKRAAVTDRRYSESVSSLTTAAASRRSAA
ncbi:MAG: hypothetical protein HY300_13320 [Verrucomicrobia bacterium]|nr:hypothetical protein [Verrucomicrobiota bacterium]